MVSVGPVDKFATAPNGASAPDSLTTENGSFFIEYGNGVASDGTGGPSTIVQYDKTGKVEHTYSIPGSVDGLKYNPTTGQIWALQNQDGNSTISLIDPVTHKVTGPLSYAAPSATHGYDDVVFKGDKVFLSQTNPVAPGDPILVQLLNGDHPSGATADVQGMCSYERLVATTLPLGLMPKVVPQLRTITLGGAVTGLGIESSSFRNGLPCANRRQLSAMIR